jgi:diadenosine tetraphosphate (Ap4A) HIT family hydrolase
MNCLFCRNHSDLQTIGDVVFESEHCAVILHEDWAVPGHAMLVWKRHVENFSELTAEEVSYFASVHRAAEKALLAATGAERAILLKLGIQVPHLHLHIYPVRATDDRAAVMAIIDGKTRTARDDGFVEAVRTAMRSHR